MRSSPVTSGRRPTCQPLGRKLISVVVFAARAEQYIVTLVYHLHSQPFILEVIWHLFIKYPLYIYI